MNDQNPNDSLDLETVSLLIPQAKGGQLDARNELMNQLQSYLSLMAARYMDPALRVKASESDIVQITIAQAIDNFENFRGGSTAEFRGWLKAILVNQIKTLQRKYHTDKRAIKRERSTENMNDESGQNFALADDCMTPSSQAIADEQLELFHKSLEELPDDYAEVIRLRSLQKLSFDEVARKMERSYDATSKLWYRAMLKFQEKIQDNASYFDSRIRKQ